MLETDDLSELPEALEEFSRKAEEAVSKAEAELKETEAILNAEPLAESYGMEDDDEEIREEKEGEGEDQGVEDGMGDDEGRDDEVLVGSYNATRVEGKAGGHDKVVFVTTDDPMGVPVAQVRNAMRNAMSEANRKRYRCKTCHKLTPVTPLRLRAVR